MQTSEASLSAALRRMLYGYQLSQVIAVAARLGIPDLLKDGPWSNDELARQTGTHSPSLYRLLRALVAAGLLTEASGRHFALTPLGILLRHDVPDSFHAAASNVTSARHWSNWGNLLHSVRTGERASKEQVWDRKSLEERPEEVALFNEFMTEVATRRAVAVLGGYDFAGIGILVDVGGGHGRLLTSILKAYPTMRGILFDVPHVVEGAKGPLEAAGVTDRCKRIGGSFFESVPEGGDAYILSVVIHDWDDERATTILKNCRRAMGASGRLLLVERVLPTYSEPPLDVLLSDLQMLVGPGGHERTSDDFRTLFSAAGFKLANIIPLEFSYNVVEGVVA